MVPGARARVNTSERPGRTVVDEAIAWLNTHRTGRWFLWVHLFEPLSPDGNRLIGGIGGGLKVSERVGLYADAIGDAAGGPGTYR